MNNTWDICCRQKATKLHWTSYLHGKVGSYNGFCEADEGLS